MCFLWAWGVEVSARALGEFFWAQVESGAHRAVLVTRRLSGRGKLPVWSLTPDFGVGSAFPSRSESDESGEIATFPLPTRALGQTLGHQGLNLASDENWSQGVQKVRAVAWEDLGKDKVVVI